mmetsp:Transcript_33050/g.55317  ORF Transcript_33050/g.55317 Transcript_33050/m.55317 type:complete len:237 (+) Transcript_33050:230-940(+)
MAKKVKSDNESEPEIDPAIERELEANNMLLFNIGEAYAERLGALEREFDQKRAPVYKTRDAILAKIPQFWLTVFLNHKTINSMLTREDVDVLEYLETFTAVTTSDETAKRETHTVTFGFRENPYFKNKVLTKKLTDFIPEEEVLTRVDTIESTKIEWNEGKDFTKTQSSKDVPKPGGKRNREDQGHFFSWFCGDDDIDSFAEVFTQDVYINAYELFLDPEDDEEDDDEEEDEDEDE